MFAKVIHQSSSYTHVNTNLPAYILTGDNIGVLCSQIVDVFDMRVLDILVNMNEKFTLPLFGAWKTPDSSQFL